MIIYFIVLLIILFCYFILQVTDAGLLVATFDELHQLSYKMFISALQSQVRSGALKFLVSPFLVSIMSFLVNIKCFLGNTMSFLCLYLLRWATWVRGLSRPVRHYHQHLAWRAHSAYSLRWSRPPRWLMTHSTTLNR